MHNEEVHNLNSSPNISHQVVRDLIHLNAATYGADYVKNRLETVTTVF